MVRHLLVTNNIFLRAIALDVHAHYLPMWPFAPPFLVCVSPTVVAQFTTRPGQELPNRPSVRKYLLLITGGRDPASMEDEEWKRRRKISPEEVSVFVDVLEKHAGGDDVCLPDETAVYVNVECHGESRIPPAKPSSTSRTMNPSTPPRSINPAISESLARASISHMKFVILRSHDTATTTLFYTLRTLSQHLAALTRLSREDLSIFVPSSDPSHLLTANLSLVNRLSDRPIDDSGTPSPTEDCLVWSCHHGQYRRPSYWERAGEFLPKRWLVEAGHKLYPVKDA
ncbi:MAG: hypothetical protein Q9173_007192 [Seirophora scorigena]